MAFFWIPPIWYGRRATDGGEGGGRLPALTGIDLGTPVHTRLIEVLQEELPNVEVWPDVDQTAGDNDSIVVINAGGEWLTTTRSWQLLDRTMRIFVFSKTSDGAERLLSDVAIIIRRRNDALTLISAVTLQGGYEEEDQVFYRGMEATFRGLK